MEKGMLDPLKTHLHTNKVPIQCHTITALSVLSAPATIVSRICFLDIKKLLVFGIARWKLKRTFSNKHSIAQMLDKGEQSGMPIAPELHTLIHQTTSVSYPAEYNTPTID